jgi:hypothetical protein
LLDPKQYVGAASPVSNREAGLNDSLSPAFHGLPSCLLVRFAREVKHGESYCAKASNVGSFVLKASLLQHAQMRIVPRWSGDLSVCEP